MAVNESEAMAGAAPPEDAAAGSPGRSSVPPPVSWPGRVAGPWLAIVLSLGSSLLALLGNWVVDPAGSFVISNQGELSERVLAMGAAWGLAALIASALVLLAERTSCPDGFRRRVMIGLAPLVLGAFLPPLLLRGIWEQQETALLVYVLAWGLALERLLTGSLKVVASSSWTRGVNDQLARWGNHPWLGRAGAVLVALGVLAYILRVGSLADISHFKLTTTSSDLAEYDNLFFNALHGHPFRSPAIAGHLDDWSTLQGHAEFGLYLLLPFYAIAPGASSLLWIQTAVVALTAFPLFLLARARLGTLAGVLFAWAFLIMPETQRPNFYDFHFTPLGMMFVVWLVYCLQELARRPACRRWRIATYSALAVALLCREDIGIGTTVIGGYLVFRGRLERDGWTIAGVSAVYFVAMKFGVMPLIGRWWFDAIYDDLKAPGARGFGAVIVTLLSNPSFVLRTMLSEPKLLYVLHMIVPVLALWLRRPLLWMALMPAFVSTLLVTNRAAMFDSAFQYNYLWLPYVMVASILAVSRKRALPTSFAVLFTCALLSVQLSVFPVGASIKGGFQLRTFEVTDVDRTRHEQLESLIAKIPAAASVAVTETEGPHVSNRLVMYSLKYTLGEDPDYLLVGRLYHPAEKVHLEQALDGGQYGVIASAGPFVLAERGAARKRNRLLERKVGRNPARRRRGSSKAPSR